MLETWTCHCGQHNAGAGPCSSCLNAAPPAIRGAVAPDPQERRPRRGLIALAILTAALLVSGVASAVIVAGDGTATTTRPPAGERPVSAAGRTFELAPDSVPGEGATDAEIVVPELMRFVQQERGLAFQHPVKVTLLSDGDFRERLKSEEEEDSEEAKEELQTTQRVLEGLGLLEKGIDLEKTLESLFGAAVAGFYDSESDDLVVRGEELTPGVRATLVHELTHALQDQHFDIDRKDLDDRDDEASSGLTGVVEGDAVRIEELYTRSLPLREQKEAERESAKIGGGIDPDIPPVLLQLVAFPYLVGPAFTRAIVRAGGQPRLDQAFREPPVTSEQLLHPEVFLRGEGPVAVDPPAPDGEKIDEGVLGELGLLLVFAASGTAGQAAARGWGGDRYVAWRDGKDTCVRTTIAMDTLQDDAELRKALDSVASSRKRVKVEGKGPITFTSCG